jgi:hypothetical protein
MGSCQEVPTGCGLFLCGPDGRCLTICSSDADCLGEAHCAGGVCAGDLEDGAPCQGPDQCLSGQCVAGVCCDSGCEGECLTCASGVCAAVSGTPCGPAGPCQGSCEAGTCVFPGFSTPCGDQTCVAGVENLPGTCDGTGRCGDGGLNFCSPYACDDDGVACRSDCFADADCAGGFVCVRGSDAGPDDGGVCCLEDKACDVLGERPVCCAGPDVCVEDAGTCCPPDRFCGDVCCDSLERCVAGACCPTEQFCRTPAETCCPVDTRCVLGECCPPVRLCGSGTFCCPEGQSCAFDGDSCKLDLGQTCNVGVECLSGSCAPIPGIDLKVCCDRPCANGCEACQPNGICQPASEGESCLPPIGSLCFDGVCAGGFCQPTTTPFVHCVDLVGACTDSYCDNATGSCLSRRLDDATPCQTAPGGLGEAGLCVSGTCVPGSTICAPCTSLSGDLCEVVAADDRCGADPDPCRTNYRCVDGTCVSDPVCPDDLRCLARDGDASCVIPYGEYTPDQSPQPGAPVCLSAGSQCASQPLSDAVCCSGACVCATHIDCFVGNFVCA